MNLSTAAKPLKNITIMDLTPHGEVIKDVSWGENNPIGGSETATMNMAAAFRRMSLAG